MCDREFSLIADNHVCINTSRSALHHDYCKREVRMDAEPICNPIPVLVKFSWPGNLNYLLFYVDSYKNHFIFTYCDSSRDFVHFY